MKALYYLTGTVLGILLSAVLLSIAAAVMVLFGSFLLGVITYLAIVGLLLFVINRQIKRLDGLIEP